MHRAISLLPSPSFLSLSLLPLLILLFRLCSSPFSHCSSRFTLSVPFLSSFHSSRINAIIFRTFSFSFLCTTLFCHESTHVRSFFYQCAVFTRVLLCPSFFLALSQPTLNRIVHSSLFLHPSESLQLSNASTFFSPAFVFYYYFRRSFSPRFKLSILFPLNYYNVRSNRKYRQSCFIQPCTFSLRCFFYYNDSTPYTLPSPSLYSSNFCSSFSSEHSSPIRWSRGASVRSYS